MGYIQVAKIVSGGNRHWGRDWYYDFRVLDIDCQQRKVTRTVSKLSQTFASEVKAWGKEECSEWVCRTYMASKLIMNATANLELSELLAMDGMELMSPTLRYYALLALCRGICLVDVSQPWKGGNLIAIGHQAAIDRTVDFMKRFDEGLAEHIKEAAELLKASREVMTYRAPTSGVEIVDEASRLGIEDLCVAMAEVVQVASEILDRAVDKFLSPGKYAVLPTHMSQVAESEIGGKTFVDHEDKYRLDYLRRKYPRPTNVQMILTEGHVDDFAEAWEEGYSEGKIDWRRLFDVA